MRPTHLKAETDEKSFHFCVKSDEKLSLVCRICVENEINVMQLGLSTGNEACNTLLTCWLATLF